MTQLALDGLTLLSLSCSFVFLLCIKSDPALLVRPSFLLTLLVHIRLQWPSVLSSQIITGNLATPGNYYLLVHGFVVIGLCCVLIAGNALGINRCSRAIWTAATRPAKEQIAGVRRQLPWLVTVTVLIAAFYFSVVPFRSTGLYALLTDPTGLGDARQASLANLNNAAASYLLTWQINTFAPMLLAAAAVWFAASRRGLGYLLLAVTLMTITGSRSGFAMSLLVLGIVFALTRWGRWRVLVPAAVIGFVLIVASTVLITLLREGQAVTRESSAAYADDAGVGRIFKTPLKTSMYHVDFADRVGPVGIASVRPLATYFHKDFVLLPRVIGRTYVDPGSPDIISNTNFLGSYYAGFGMWAIPISIVGLLIFDLLLIPLSRVTDFALPITAMLVVKAMAASEGVLHTSLINGGYILLPFIAWWMASRAARQPEESRLPVRPTARR